MTSKWILAGPAAVLGIGVTLSPAEPVTIAVQAPATKGDVAHGKQVFVATGCYQCHGYVGQGAQSTGPALVPMRLGDEDFVRYLRLPSGVMPSFSTKVLPAADARDVLAYIRSLNPGASPEQIALLKPYVAQAALRRAPVAAAAMGVAALPGPTAPVPDEGATLYAANCAVCHGAQREGGMGPALKGKGSTLSAERIAALIVNPPPGMPRLSPTPLDAAQVTKVARFVHSRP